MGLPMQQKERNFQHVDENKKQGFSNGFLRDIVISFILAGRDTTYASRFTTLIFSSFCFFYFFLERLIN
jgi:hypothetical protein